MSIKRLISTLICCIITLIFAVNISVKPCYAISSEKGTLTIYGNATNANGRTFYMANDTYSIVKIASADTSGVTTVYRMTDEFSAWNIDFYIMTSSEMNTTAKELSKYAAKHNLYTLNGATDVYGMVNFQNLDEGMYLVSRTYIHADNAEYICDPFLVSIPLMNNNTPLYNIEIEPKFERIIIKTETTPPQTTFTITETSLTDFTTTPVYSETENDYPFTTSETKQDNPFTTVTKIEDNPQTTTTKPVTTATITETSKDETDDSIPQTSRQFLDILLTLFKCFIIVLIVLLVIRFFLMKSDKDGFK